LEEEKGKYGDTDSMMRVRKTSLWSHGKISKNEDGYQHQSGKNVDLGMVFDGPAGTVGVESCRHDGEGDEEEEYYHGHDGVG
jgi:hypothetical protein